MRNKILYIIALLLLPVVGIWADDYDPVNPPDPTVRHKVTVSVSPADAGYASGSGQYSKGEWVYLSTSAYSGYEFQYWTRNGERISSDRWYSFSMPSDDVEMVAVYTEKDIDPETGNFSPVNPDDPTSKVTTEFRLFLDTNEPGSCSFNITSGSYQKAGEYIYVNAYCYSQGFHFLGWYLDDKLISNTQSFSYLMPKKDVTLLAKFYFDPSSPMEPYFPEEIVQVARIKAMSYSREYGEKNPAFEYTTNMEIDGTPKLICDAETASPAGQYIIYVDTSEVNNEVVNLTNGTLTVTKAPLTVTAKSYTIKQGDELPTFELSLSGFKNGENADVLKKQPVLTCVATSDSDPGTYDIIASGAMSTNYAFDYVKGTLTINEADPITITAKSYSREYGEANPVFEYTSEGAELKGTPAIACEATEKTPVGTYDIVVSKGAVKNYNDTYVKGKLTITKAPLTVTAKDYTIKQGDEMPVFEVDYSGFKNDEAADVLAAKPVVTCEATSDSEPGTYDIIVSGGEAGNYEFSYVKGTLTVKQADPVTITAKSYTREYGESNPLLEYTSEGAVLKGTPDLSCEADEKSPVGTYDIVVSKGSVKNYNDSYVNGTLTITKAPLTVTGKNYVIKQGDDMPVFEAEFSGFKNDETVDVVTVKPSFSCEATSGSPLGTYDIIVSGCESENYGFNYVKGTLTIIAADAMLITAKSYTREYGEANPVFEYTVEGPELKGEPVISCEATETSEAGTYDIIVSQGTVGNFNVTYMKGTLTITKAPLTVTAKSYTIKRGDAMPTFEAEYSGFKNNETAEVLTSQPTLSTTATSDSEVGSYDIVANGAVTPNYAVSYVKGTLTINQADPITITAKSYSREYGDANPAFEYTSEGAELKGTPAIACEATEKTPVGTYDIAVSKGAVKNYNDTYVNGTLTITKAPLTVTAKDYTIKQGDEMPVFEVDYSGFKNDEAADVLAAKPVVTCEATSGSPIGTYDIIVSGGEAQNYEFSYVKGTLTIVAADAIIVTANSYSREYGESNPEFEYTVDGGELKGTPVITCEANEKSAVGNYDIVIAKGAVSNYNVTFVKGKLTVTKAPLTVTAKDYTIKQGDEMPVFEVDYSGFKNGDTLEVLKQLPVIVCEATSESEPGTYDIVVSGAEASNYAMTFVNGTLTIIADNQPSAVTTVRREDAANPVIYDLLGRRVEHPGKGIYIVNGRRVVISK